MKYSALAYFLAPAVLFANTVWADAPVIESATAENRGNNWTISVTLSHPDTGWDHYADGWEVLGPDGASLGLRVLAHPHVNEQPFTRSLGSIVIPGDATHIFIRARDNTEGWGVDQFRLDLNN